MFVKLAISSAHAPHSYLALTVRGIQDFWIFLKIKNKYHNSRASLRCNVKIFLMREDSFSFPSDTTTFSWEELSCLFYLSPQRFLLCWKTSYTSDYDKVLKCQLAEHLSRGRWGINPSPNEPPVLDFSLGVLFSLVVSRKYKNTLSFLCVIFYFTSWPHHL